MALKLSQLVLCVEICELNIGQLHKANQVVVQVTVRTPYNGSNSTGTHGHTGEEVQPNPIGGFIDPDPCNNSQRSQAASRTWSPTFIC